MRKLADWIEGFLAYTAARNSPEEFRRWAAVSAVAAGLQRRCWMRIMGRELYPNLFILLVADPGVGKSNAIFSARNVIKDFPKLKLSPQRITKEAFYEELEAAQVNFLQDPGHPVVSHHPLTAMVDEFGVFVRRGDLDFMADLADLYDCPDPFQYKTKHQSSQNLRRAWFNFISGCTPAWIKEAFTEIALEQGFPARIIAVYSTQKHVPNLWQTAEETSDSMEVLQLLKEDFNDILEMTGEFVWHPDAAQAFQSWVDDGMRPFPQDPRLRHYCSRRTIHVAKLAIVLSASRSNLMEVLPEDFKQAQTLLLSAEKHMHEAYANVGKNPYFAAVESAVKFAMIEYRRTKRPVMEHTLARALEREVPYTLVRQILDQLIATKRLNAMGEYPRRLFTPGGEEDEGTRGSSN